MPYSQDRYKNDPEYRQQIRDKENSYRRNKYATDEDYRQTELQRQKENSIGQYRKRRGGDYKKIKIHHRSDSNTFRVKLRRKDLKIDKTFKTLQEAEEFIKTLN